MDRGRQNLGGGSWNPHVSSFICYPHLHPSPASVSPAGPPCGGGEGSESRQLGHFLLCPQLIRGRRQDPVGCLRWHLPRPRSEGHHRRRKRQTNSHAGSRACLAESLRVSLGRRWRHRAAVVPPSRSGPGCSLPGWPSPSPESAKTASQFGALGLRPGLPEPATRAHWT